MSKVHKDKPQMTNDERLSMIEPSLFKQQILGSPPWEIEEADDEDNYPPDRLRQQFVRVCDLIGQPCAIYKAIAKPGDWYISLEKHSRHPTFHIMEMTETGGGGNPITMDGMGQYEMFRALIFVECFISQQKRIVFLL
jgi:hypothetical protein